MAIEQELGSINIQSYIWKYSHEWLDKELVELWISNLSQAFERLKSNKNFNKEFWQLSIDDIFSLMIKESLLDNTRKSRTWALWYFQLKPDAIKDAEEKLKDFWIKERFDPRNPIDNCILWITYISISKELTNNALKWLTYWSEFDFLAYNWWAGRVKSMVEMYKKEKNIEWNILNWDDFVYWLVWKIEKNVSFSLISSKEYNISYRNWFKKDWSEDDSTIDFLWIKTKKSKIYEMINYVEKIKAIKETNQKNKVEHRWEIERKYWEQKTKVTASSCFQRLSVIIDYDKTVDNFNWEWFIDRNWYDFKKYIWYNDKYKQVKAERWDGAISLLKKAWIQPTEENKDKFYDINDLDNDDKIKLWAYYLLPNIEKTESQEIEEEVNQDTYYSVKAEKWDGVLSILKKSWVDPTKENQAKFSSLNCLTNWNGIKVWEYYLIPNVWKLEQSQENIKEPSVKIRENHVKPEISSEKPDFYKWLDSIEVKSHELKWKVFILDPWHWWWDPWAIPIANDKNWEPIVYTQSDINWNQRVQNWQWDWKLRVIEAKVTMDVSYRLAKLIKEHWWIIKITHYFQKWIDDETWTQSSNNKAPWLLDQLEYYDTWWDDWKDKFDEWSLEWLRKRVRVRELFKKWVKNDNLFFISIHADKIWVNTNPVWVNILHAKDSSWQQRFAKKLSEAMWNVRQISTTYWTREKWIYVLNPKVWAHNQNVLIELWNMNNENTSYALRSWKTRQDYAEWIFKWLLSVATK